MRIALVTEQFLPASTPPRTSPARSSSRLVDAGHDVIVFAGGRGQATFRGARMFWASRMTSVSAVREAMALVPCPTSCHLVDPHRLGIKAAEAAERLGVPTLVLDPRTWQPGRRPARPPPRPARPDLHDRWARMHSPDGGQLIVGHVGPPREAEGAQPAGHGRQAPRGPPRGARRRPRRGHAPLRRRQGDPPRDQPRTGPLQATFDVLVQPRKKEVYAPAVHEALASGVPVVAFDGGTASEVVRSTSTTGSWSTPTAATRPSPGPWHGWPPAPTCASRWLRTHALGLRTAPGRTPSPSCSTCTTPPPYDAGRSRSADHAGRDRPGARSWTSISTAARRLLSTATVATRERDGRRR